VSDETIRQRVTILDHQVEVRVDVFARIGQAIETAATLDELMLLSLYELGQFFGTTWGAVGLLDESRRIQIAGEYPPQVIAPPPVPLDQLPAVWQVVEQREVVLVQLSPDDASSPYADILRARDIYTILLIPLISRDTAMGVLALCASGAPRVFDSAELTLARVLASQVATAIASLRLHEAAGRRAEELATLNEIAAAITSTLDTREVYRLVVQKLSAYFHVEAGSLLLITEPHGDLEFVMTIEGGEEKLAGVRVPAGQGIVGD
jgi:two-component system, NtrC family, sensor histidine kinase KinB